MENAEAVFPRLYVPLLHLEWGGLMLLKIRLNIGDTVP